MELFFCVFVCFSFGHLRSCVAATEETWELENLPCSGKITPITGPAPNGLHWKVDTSNIFRLKWLYLGIYMCVHVYINIYIYTHIRAHTYIKYTYIYIYATTIKKKRTQWIQRRVWMGLYECLEGEKGGANDGIIIKNK